MKSVEDHGIRITSCNIFGRLMQVAQPRSLPSPLFWITLVVIVGVYLMWDYAVFIHEARLKLPPVLTDVQKGWCARAGTFFSFLAAFIAGFVMFWDKNAEETDHAADLLMSHASDNINILEDNISALHPENKRRIDLHRDLIEISIKEKARVRAYKKEKYFVGKIALGLLSLGAILLFLSGIPSPPDKGQKICCITKIGEGCE